MHEHIARSAGATIGFLGRMVGYSAAAIAGVGLTTLAVFEGLHQYVELGTMKPLQIDDSWDWELEAYQWSGGERGGTDPALGLRGQHLVRAAWMVLNWGIGMDEAVVGTNSKGKKTTVVKRVQYAEAFMSEAVAEAEQKLLDGAKLRPETLPELRTIYASLLESMGTEDALYEARTQYERVWSALSPLKNPSKLGRIALKLGNVNEQLGEAGAAEAWWSRALHLSGLIPSSNTQDVSNLALGSTPPSPIQQRNAASALVALSAHYSTHGQLKQAQSVQSSALTFLRSIPTPPSLETASPPQALHALYILHRSALLSIHHAEVLYALRHPTKASTQWLFNAAESSERVIHALTGSTAEAPKSSLATSYAQSPTLATPAEKLLRGARQSSAESWNLMGMLLEKQDKKRAAECFEKALFWGDTAMLQKDAKMVQNNLDRVKTALSK